MTAVTRRLLTSGRLLLVSLLVPALTLVVRAINALDPALETKISHRFRDARNVPIISVCLHCSYRAAATRHPPETCPHCDTPLTHVEAFAQPIHTE